MWYEDTYLYFNLEVEQHPSPSPLDEWAATKVMILACDPDASDVKGLTASHLFNGFLPPPAPGNGCQITASIHINFKRKYVLYI